MTFQSELSTMIGTLAILGSAETRLRNRVMACSPSMRPSSMLMSMMFAPPSTWSRATASAASKSPVLIKRANRFEPVMFVRSPTMTKLVSGRMTSGSIPL